jgi:putative alpha-1,2-mannosidase
MKYSKVTVALLSSLIATSPIYAETGAQRDPINWVNPLIGTANGGNVFPGAVVPFGMVQFSPETSPFKPKSPIAAPGGYEYRSDKIRGFSLTNVEGWGCGGGSGDIPIMPVAEAIVSSPSSDFRYAYTSHFMHDKEQARPGHYHVVLDSGIGVDLTASLHTGSAIFSFPEGSPANLLVRTSDSEIGSTDAHTTVDTEHRTVSGPALSSDRSLA